LKFKNLINIKRQINKPEYFYNPSLFIRRLFYKNKNRQNLQLQIDDSGYPFYISESDVIGQSILKFGVYDLIVAETMKRILKPNDCFFDVGANIGFFSRKACELQAHVTSFEPHPLLFEKLKSNLKYLQNLSTLHNYALSDSEGTFDLYIPEQFGKNQGVASLVPQKNCQSIKVETKILDNIIKDQIKLLKIDVEGHELSVLKGAKKSLIERKIEFIVFEDFNGKDSEVIHFLNSLGYQSKRLKKNLWGPSLVPISESEKIPLWEPPNFIASFSMDKINEVFKRPGWQYYK
jgi:FkbM family methyltransferase